MSLFKGDIANLRSKNDLNVLKFECKKCQQEYVKQLSMQMKVIMDNQMITVMFINCTHKKPKAKRKAK